MPTAASPEHPYHMPSEDEGLSSGFDEPHMAADNDASGSMASKAGSVKSELLNGVVMTETNGYLDPVRMRKFSEPQYEMIGVPLDDTAPSTLKSNADSTLSSAKESSISTSSSWLRTDTRLSARKGAEPQYEMLGQGHGPESPYALLEGSMPEPAAPRIDASLGPVVESDYARIVSENIEDEDP